MQQPQLRFWNYQADFCKSASAAVEGSNIGTQTSQLKGCLSGRLPSEHFSGRNKQTAEFQGVQRAIQKPAFWRTGDVATLSVQIENGLPIRPAGERTAGGRQGPVKKADRGARPPGDVRALN